MKIFFGFEKKKITVMKFWISHKMDLLILWEAQDFITGIFFSNPKNIFGKNIFHIEKNR